MNATVIENSTTPDRRALVACAPFRVIAGRGIVDARGRLILRCHAWQTMNAEGETHTPDYENGLTPCEADGNAHAIARALNAAHAARDVNARTVSFIANLSHAIRNRETVSIGGGLFTPDDLAPVLAALKVADTSGLVDALREKIARYHAIGEADAGDGYNVAHAGIARDLAALLGETP